MKKLHIICLVALFFLSSLMSTAKELTLEQCFQYAFEHNPQLQMEQKNIEKSRILIGTAFDAPNTSIELSQDATEGGGMDNGLKFSQEFDFPTVYVARRKVLKAEYSLAQDALNVKKNEILGGIVSAYYARLYFNNKIASLQRLDSVYTRFVFVAGERLKVGETSRLELINAQRLKAKNEMELRNTLMEMKQSNITLMSLLGANEEITPAERDLPVIEASDLLGDIVPATTLEGKLRESELALSEKNLSAAKQEFLPGIFVGATSQLLLKGFNPYHIDRKRFEKGDFMGIQVGITVPLFFGAKRARLLAAKKDVELAKIKIEDEHLRINTEFSEAKNEFFTAAENLKYYESTGVQQANELARLAQISYDLGEIEYLEYIQNLETSASLRLEYLDSINRYNQSVIKLKTLKGLL